MAIGRMAKYNDVGAGAKPILGNTSMLSMDLRVQGDRKRLLLEVVELIRLTKAIKPVEQCLVKHLKTSMVLVAV